LVNRDLYLRTHRYIYTNAPQHSLSTNSSSSKFQYSNLSDRATLGKMSHHGNHCLPPHVEGQLGRHDHGKGHHGKHGHGGGGHCHEGGHHGGHGHGHGHHGGLGHSGGHHRGHGHGGGHHPHGHGGGHHPH
jgi:hypothetical protein